MSNKDEYVVMNVAQNLTEIANTLKKVLGDSEIVQEFYANLKLLYSTQTMTKTFNTVISHIVAGEEPSVEILDLSKYNPNDPCWIADNKKPAKTSNQQRYEREHKQRRKKDKSV